ncbi:hypothetical protein P3T73_06780 [Kiritimatiellota bacterium B12222]|nr:hypothetical protein P3T73_06780 [Kiritimatiellota bacterium B12222]
MTHLIPPHADLGHLKKQAKRLLRAAQQAKPDALRRFSQSHPAYAKGTVDPLSFRLQEAQHVIACEYGVSSWAALTAVVGPEKSLAFERGSDLLIFSNGSSALTLFEKVGLPGRKEEWTDVLHDGPVPVTASVDELNRIRAKFLSGRGWAGFDGILSRFQKRDQLLARGDEFSELQIWFEHDLFDQLLLIQIIDRLAEDPEWSAITKVFQFDRYIGRLTTETFSAACPAPQALRQDQIDEARNAWRAFRGSDPQALTKVIREGSSSLPYLKSALLRFCEEFPWVQNGCSRTEQQILEAVHAGIQSPEKIFQHSQAQEEAIFMGDGTFYVMIEQLTLGAHPLLTLAPGPRFLHPSIQGYGEAFRNQQLRLTERGEQVLVGRANRLTDLPQPYWRGGCEIRDEKGPCWDGMRKCFV